MQEKEIIAILEKDGQDQTSEGVVNSVGGKIMPTHNTSRTHTQLTTNNELLKRQQKAFIVLQIMLEFVVSILTPLTITVILFALGGFDLTPARTVFISLGVLTMIFGSLIVLRNPDGPFIQQIAKVAYKLTTPKRR